MLRFLVIPRNDGASDGSCQISRAITTERNGVGASNLRRLYTIDRGTRIRGKTGIRKLCSSPQNRRYCNNTTCAIRGVFSEPIYKIPRMCARPPERSPPRIVALFHCINTICCLSNSASDTPSRGVDRCAESAHSPQGGGCQT